VNGFKGTPYALNFTRIEIGGTLFMRECLTAGEVRLLGAAIKGRLDCRRSTFRNAGTDFQDGNKAVNARDAVFSDGIIWTDLYGGAGEICWEFSQARVLRDDEESYNFHNFSIDGFVYDMIFCKFDNIGFRQRIVRDSVASYDQFRPQPYQQLAKVYGEMGHRRDRKTVLIEMESGLRRWQAEELRAVTSGPITLFRYLYHCITSNLYGWGVGYGHRPVNSFIIAFIIVFATSWGAKWTWDAGDFTPTAAPILVSQDWQKWAEWGASKNPAHNWSYKTNAGRDYSTFHPVYYAADLFIPLVEFGQDKDWAPSTSRSWRGIWMHWIEPWIRLFGWIVTAMGAAAITGFIRND